MTNPLNVDTSLESTSVDTGLPDPEGITPWGFGGSSFDIGTQVGVANSDSPQGLPVPDTSSGAVTGGSTARNIAINEAKKYIGRYYHWGGSNPNTSFDCSGLTQWSLGKAGIRLPRISYQQAGFGTRTEISKLQAGDLVAWDWHDRHGRGRADHIALYLGNGMVLEAPHTGAKIRIRKIGKNEPAWGVHLSYPGDH